MKNARQDANPPRSIGVRLHIILFVGAVLATYLLSTCRLTGQLPLVLLPWLGAAVSALNALVLLRFAFTRWFKVEPPAWLLSTERMVMWSVVGCLGGGLFLFVNAAFDSSLPLEYRANVVQVGSADIRHLGIPYSWATLRSARGGEKIEYVLLHWSERPNIWAGQPVIVSLGFGFLRVPWIRSIGLDLERQAQAVLRVTPTAAGSLRKLTYAYLLREDWDATADAARAYLKLYPHDVTLALHVAEALVTVERFGDVISVSKLSPP